MDDRMELIDILRENIKRTEIYDYQNNFYKEIEENVKDKEKFQHTTLFHKICTYLHMALESEHKEKWATKEDKKLR